MTTMTYETETNTNTHTTLHTYTYGPHTMEVITRDGDSRVRAAYTDRDASPVHLHFGYNINDGEHAQITASVSGSHVDLDTLMFATAEAKAARTHFLTTLAHVHCLPVHTN